jgi:perosamine synthetase
VINHSSASFSYNETESISKLLQSGLVTVGVEHLRFKQEFSDYIGSEFVKLTSSGTMAFFLILKALDIKTGDEILLPDYICKDILGPVFALGATPILYDNKPNSWLSSTKDILSKITSKSKLVLVNHTFGFVFKEIKSLAQQLSTQVHIVEDCCHAIIGTKCSFSIYTRSESICCFYSFNATKLIASGEGGAISSNNKSFIKELEKIKIGDNLSDLNCAIARIQLQKLNFFIEERKKIASKYLSAFADFLSIDHLENSGIFFRFPLLISNNKQFWKSNFVAYRKGVDSLLSDSIGISPLTNTAKVFNNTVSIPIYPSLSDNQVNEIINETKSLMQL